MKTVMCFGTFDLLHLGHIYYLTQAKKQGDNLIVVIARDMTKKKQGKVTFFSEKERLELVQNIKCVDLAVLGNYPDHFKVIEKHKPDVLCLGYDHAVSQEALQIKLAERNLHPQIVRIKPYKLEKQKSSKIKEWIFSNG